MKPLEHLKSASDVFERVLRREAESLRHVSERLVGLPVISEVLEALHTCRGRLVMTGAGKMSSIARKAASTFASTGSPSLFVQPAEALHGDLGMIRPGDVLVALSYSGETDEVLRVAETVREWGISTLVLTGSVQSSLAKVGRWVVDISVPYEAIDEWPIPTCSSTVALAVCDSLAIALLEIRGFSAQDFLGFHPGGNLGRRLSITVGDLMHRGNAIPLVKTDAKLRAAIVEMTEKSLGATLVVDETGCLVGVLTDGDVRRTIQRHDNPLDQSVASFMTTPGQTCSADWLAVRALELMESMKITVLPVVTEKTEVIGVLHLHDLLGARIV